MNRLATVLLVAGIGPALSLSPAHAQSAPICSFDAGSATLTVAVDGNPATLSIASRAIRLNGTPCGTATVDNTDSIAVTGGSRVDVVTVSGSYKPGLSPEADGSSEIEMTFSLGGGRDTVKLNGTAPPVSTLFPAVPTRVSRPPAPPLRMSLPFPPDADDDIVGGSTGDDLLHGGLGNDKIYGNDGADTFYGEDGDDIFYTSDGIGEGVNCGDGTDTVFTGGDGGGFFDCENIH